MTCFHLKPLIKNKFSNHCFSVDQQTLPTIVFCSDNGDNAFDKVKTKLRFFNKMYASHNEQWPTLLEGQFYKIKIANFTQRSGAENLSTF